MQDTWSCALTPAVLNKRLTAIMLCQCIETLTPWHLHSLTTLKQRFHETLLLSWPGKGDLTLKYVSTKRDTEEGEWRVLKRVIFAHLLFCTVKIISKFADFQWNSFLLWKKKRSKNANLRHKKEPSKLDLCGASAEGREQRLHREKYIRCAITVEPEQYCGISVCVCDEA